MAPSLFPVTRFADVLTAMIQTASGFTTYMTAYGNPMLWARAGGSNWLKPKWMLDHLTEYAGSSL